MPNRSLPSTRFRTYSLPITQVDPGIACCFRWYGPYTSNEIEAFEVFDATSNSSDLHTGVHAAS
jgi:hypothetical protein